MWNSHADTSTVKWIQARKNEDDCAGEMEPILDFSDEETVARSSGFGDSKAAASALSDSESDDESSEEGSILTTNNFAALQEVE